MSDKKNKLFEIFITTLSSSATASNGFAIIAAMKKKFVDDKGWIDEKDMSNYVALAQSAPGPMAISSSMVVGYQLAGVMGAIMAMLGVIIPPIIIMTLVFYFYELVVTSQWIALAFKGMQIAVCALILSITFDNIKAIAKGKKIFYLFLIAVAYVLTGVLKISVLYALIFAAVSSVVYCKVGGKK